jgi:hypothetical protein
MTPSSTATVRPAAASAAAASWPTTRILFALAVIITTATAGLAASVSNGFLLLTGFVGVNQLLYVAFGACPASLLIDHLRPTSAMLSSNHAKEN